MLGQWLGDALVDGVAPVHAREAVVDARDVVDLPQVGDQNALAYVLVHN